MLRITLLQYLLICVMGVITVTVIGEDTDAIRVERKDLGERIIAGKKVAFTVERVFRGKRQILTIYRTGKFVTRIYEVGDSVGLVTERDEDGDGFFEQMTVHDPISHEFEMFIKGKDGSVTPISSKEMEEKKKEAKFWSIRVKQLFEKAEDKLQLENKERK